MKKFIRNLVRNSLIAAAFVAMWFSSAAHAVTPVAQEEDEPIIVVFKEGTPEWKREIIHGLVGGKRKQDRGELSRINGQVVHVAKGRRAAMLAQYRKDGAVAFAEVDALLSPAATPNDPSYSGQWHLAKIQAPLAWDTTKGNSSLIIAICDTGVDPNHPDLKDRLLAGYNSDDGSTNWSDIHGHGTAVAGTAAAIGNNGTFGTGVMWNCKILPVRITNATNGVAYMSRAVAAITWAADNGAKVINLSYETYANGALSSTVLSACRYAESKGAVVVIAAGNLNTNPAGNGDPSEAIYVSAVDSSDVKSSFSNYGPYIDIAAPGQNIYTTKMGGGYGPWNGTSFAAPIVAGVMGLIFSANPALSVADAKQILFSNADNIGSATYFGAGRVNAARAVQAAGGVTVNQPPVITLISPSNNSTFLTTDLITFRASASDPEDGDVTSRITWMSSRDGALGNGGSFSDYLSSGTHTITIQVTDLNGLMTTMTITVTVSAPQTINAPSNLAATTSTLSVTLTWKDNSSNESGFSIERALQSANPAYTVIAVVGANVKTYKHTAASGGTYLFRVRGYNSQTTSNYSNTVTVTVTAPNQTPTLTINSPTNNASFLTTSVITFSATASDTEDGNISNNITWKRNGTTFGSGASFTASLAAGSYTISATVTDSGGASVTKSVSITVTAPANQAPTLTINSPANNGSFLTTSVITFSATATDAEDGNLSNNITWRDNGFFLGYGASFTAQLAAGTHTISVYVTDSAGSSVMKTVTVTVNLPSNQPPSLAITSPSNLSAFTNSQTVTFAAQAIDPEDGDISSQIVWKLGSTVIGNGASCSVLLTVGTHIVTASVTDSSGTTVTQSITVTIEEPPPLAAPSNFFGRTTYVDPLQCRLYWTDEVSGGAEGFVLEYALVPADGSQPQFAVAGILPPNAGKRYVDTRASAGLYRYRVRAFKGGQFSNYSEVIELRIR
jgi:thermitase